MGLWEMPLTEAEDPAGDKPGHSHMKFLVTPMQRLGGQRDLLCARTCECGCLSRLWMDRDWQSSRSL